MRVASRKPLVLVPGTVTRAPRSTASVSSVDETAITGVPAAARERLEARWPATAPPRASAYNGERSYAYARARDGTSKNHAALVTGGALRRVHCRGANVLFAKGDRA